MNIQSSKLSVKPKQNASHTESSSSPAKAEDSPQKGDSPVDVFSRSTDNEPYRIPVSTKRIATTGIGSAAGIGVGLLLGGGWGALAAAAAVGGASGAAVSSQTASNLWTKAKGAYTDFKEGRAEAARQERFEEESAAKAVEQFEKTIEEEAYARARARMDKEGESMVEARTEKLLNKWTLVDAEERAEELVDERVESLATEKFEAIWAKDGQKLLDEELERRVEERVEYEIDDNLEYVVEERYEVALEEGVQKALVDRKAEMDESIDAEVKAYLQEYTEDRIDQLSEITEHSQSLETHQELGQGTDKTKVSLEHFRDGLEIFLAAGKELHPGDKALAEKALAVKEKDKNVSYNHLDQVIEVLKYSTGEEPASLDASSYLKASGGSDVDDQSKLYHYQAGLEVLLEHGSLEPGQKLLCENALRKLDGKMDKESKADYVEGVFSALTGE